MRQLKNQNEMKLHDESWLNYQKGKGEEAFQAYMADLWVYIKYWINGSVMSALCQK